MNVFCSSLTATFLWSVIGISLAAEFPDYPTITMAHGEKGNRSSIYIDCKPSYQTQMLDCQFVQMRLLYVLNAEDFDTKLQERLSETYATPGDELLKVTNDFCKMYQENSGNFQQKLEDFETQSSREYAVAGMKVMGDACDVETSAQAKELIDRISRLSLERDAASCKIWPHLWEEQFEYQQSQKGGYWVARDGPSGECGVVLVSTLKNQEDYPMFWNYESQKIITNKEGEDFLLSCSERDEERVSYTWQSVNHDVDCDVLGFGP